MSSKLIVNTIENTTGTHTINLDSGNSSIVGDLTVGGTFTSQGIDVTGTVTADGLTVDGSGSVSTGSSGASAASNADDFVVEAGGDGDISILTPSTNTGTLFFGDNTVSNAGQIKYSHSAGSFSFVTEQNTRMLIDASGNVQNGDYASNSGATNGYILRQVGSSANTAATFELLTSSTSTRHHIAFRSGATSGNSSGAIRGSISTSSTSTSYNTSSDYRLKENVVELTGATDRLKQLNPSRFNFIADADTTVDGFLAHEVQSVVPEAITGTKDAVDDDGNPVYQGIDQGKLVPLLTAALQEALTKIDALETRITALEAV